jgi:hypothetical protein
MKEYLILGTDKPDAERQRDLWLSQNPAIKVIKIHEVKREPQNLLTRIGGKRVPRVSIMVEYEYEKSNALLQGSRTVLSKKSHGEKDAGEGGKQSQSENLFAGEAHFHMKDIDVTLQRSVPRRR